MPNEKDTKASNENTLSAYESLFGDMEADTADTNAEERAPKHGTDPAQPNSDAIEDQAKLDVEETQAGEAGPTMTSRSSSLSERVWPPSAYNGPRRTLTSSRSMTWTCPGWPRGSRP